MLPLSSRGERVIAEAFMEGKRRQDRETMIRAGIGAGGRRTDREIGVKVHE